MVRMGWAGTILKYIIVTGFIIVFWELTSWLISIIFAIPSGQLVLGNQTLTFNFGLQPDMSWYGWKSWMVYGWDMVPIMAFIGNTLWVIAKSQQRDTAEVQQPLGPL